MTKIDSPKNILNYKFTVESIFEVFELAMQVLPPLFFHLHLTSLNLKMIEIYVFFLFSIKFLNRLLTSHILNLLRPLLNPWPKVKEIESVLQLYIFKIKDLCSSLYALNSYTLHDYWENILHILKLINPIR